MDNFFLYFSSRTHTIENIIIKALRANMFYVRYFFYFCLLFLALEVPPRSIFIRSQKAIIVNLRAAHDLSDGWGRTKKKATHTHNALVNKFPFIGR